MLQTTSRIYQTPLWNGLTRHTSATELNYGTKNVATSAEMAAMIRHLKREQFKFPYNDASRCGHHAQVFRGRQMHALGSSNQSCTDAHCDGVIVEIKSNAEVVSISHFGSKHFKPANSNQDYFWARSPGC